VSYRLFTILGLQTSRLYSSDFQPGFCGTQGFREHLPRVPRSWPAVKWFSLQNHTRQCCRNTQHRFFWFKIAFLHVIFAQTYCVESFLLLVKFWLYYLHFWPIYYTVSFLRTTSFNSKALSETKKKRRRTYWLHLCLRNRLAIYLVNSIC